MTQKVLLSWSSGKDSAWTLHQLLADPNVEVVGLFTTINQPAGRVAMHGVNVELLRLQAQRLQLPLDIIELPFPCTNADYERILHSYLAGNSKNDSNDDSLNDSNNKTLIAQGVDALAFGDLYLEDVRRYREQQLQGSGYELRFPLWGKATAVLSREMVDSGLRAIVSCIDSRRLDRRFVGQLFDHDFLDRLPVEVDPCGENGEFHSFVCDASIFNDPIHLATGEQVARDGFVFVDLIPS